MGEFRIRKCKFPILLLNYLEACFFTVPLKETQFPLKMRDLSNSEMAGRATNLIRGGRVWPLDPLGWWDGKIGSMGYMQGHTIIFTCFVSSLSKFFLYMSYMITLFSLVYNDVHTLIDFEGTRIMCTYRLCIEVAY